MIMIEYSSTAFIITDKPTHTTSKKWYHAPHLRIYHLEKKTLCCQLCSIHYRAVRINSYLKRTSAIKVTTIKLWMISMTNGSHHVPTTKLTLFIVSKDEWGTKKGTGKSMKIALYAQWYGKRHLLGWSDVEQWKIKPIALAIVELRESEGIKQAGRQAGGWAGRQAGRRAGR